MSKIILTENIESIQNAGLPANVAAYFTSQWQEESASNSYKSEIGTWYLEPVKGEGHVETERLRKIGFGLCKSLNTDKQQSVEIVNTDNRAEYALALAEGILLSNYKFDKYLKDRVKNTNTLSNVSITGDGAEGLDEIKIIVSAVLKARELVNEPVNHLNAIGLSEAFEEMGKEAGFSVEVWHEAQIESQKMGGLLAVNMGSQDPPTFSIMEYKPANAKNDKPIVLVGKGVVFDTGGLSLKPTPASMDQMKCDMAGSAAVGGIMYASAKLKLPLWIIALVPATDNRPGENAICPSDIITTYNGTTVEVLNTDAEGRLILCDALAFAQKYNPELVMDFATLTGAAMRALGSYGSVMIGTASDDVKKLMQFAGERVYERLAEFPLWQEYEDEMKGDISDLKNLGKADGGAQTAAAFLKYFTNYPWLHFDIAGTAFNVGGDSYRGKGGTGIGVRLIVEFLKHRANG